mmetsp:Transcript_26706/g.74815  ORF Transcript_26706/g.74815 Transcript_26706/m.74815 type:complete len:145 (-) Transcript_26706:92-526(-)
MSSSAYSYSIDGWGSNENARDSINDSINDSISNSAGTDAQDDSIGNDAHSDAHTDADADADVEVLATAATSTNMEDEDDEEAEPDGVTNERSGDDIASLCELQAQLEQQQHELDLARRQLQEKDELIEQMANEIEKLKLTNGTK